MKVLVLDAMRRHLNSNPEIIHSITAGFRRASASDVVACAMRWDFESIAERFQPDLVLAVASQIWPEVAVPLASLRARRKMIAGWWLTDDPYEIDGSLSRAGLFDFVASNDLASAAHYTETAALHVPLAADRDRHFREIRRDDRDYEWDVVFCGVAFPNRIAWLEAAAPVLAQYKTLFVGPGWPSLPCTSLRRVANVELTDLYNASRIVLNLPRALDLCNRNGFCASTPAPRTFEAAAAGGFQLVAADRPELHRYFEIPAEMEVFVSVRDLHEKIQWHLGYPEARIEAAARAQRRVLQSHLYEHRAAVILDHAWNLAAVSSHVANPRPRLLPDAA